LLFKIAFSDFNINLEQLNLNDVLSLVLAIFSICLSVAFYFKSCDSSNLFYDNTYKFTKDISQILARIESGFGEKLDHIDEGYNSLSGLFSKDKIQDKKEEIKGDTDEVNRITNERNELLLELANKAKLNEKERKEFLEKIDDKNNEIQDLRRNIYILQRQLEAHSSENSIQYLYRELPLELRRFIRNDYIPLLQKNGYVSDISSRMLMRIVEKTNKDIPDFYLEQMVKAGLLSEDKTITRTGMRLINYIA